MSEISHHSRQMDLFDWRVKLPVNGTLQLVFEVGLPKHQRVERAVLRVAAAHPNGVVRISVVKEHLASEGAIRPNHADYCLLHRVLSQSGAFDREAHGVYRLRREYRPKPVLTENQALLLRHLRNGIVHQGSGTTVSPLDQTAREGEGVGR